MSEAESLSDRAATRLSIDQPFFGTLLAMTPLIPDPALATLATNGEAVYFSPGFLGRLKASEVLGVLVHELMHIVYLHCDETRRGARRPELWNAACDYAINQEIKAWGFQLPAGVLFDPKYRGLPAEEIYRVLFKRPCPCALDRLMPMPAERRDEIEGRILAAAESHRGRLPRGIERWIRLVRAPKVPWRRILQRFLREQLGRAEESFLPPNKRHLWDERYLPAATRAPSGRLAVAVDTSASISSETLEAFAAELRALADLCETMTVLACDAKVHEKVRASDFASLVKGFRFKGGGGTDFRPVFDELKAARARPAALVYLTDGQGTFPRSAPREFPVLWCLTGQAKAPWGLEVFLPQARRPRGSRRAGAARALFGTFK